MLPSIKRYEELGYIFFLFLKYLGKYRNFYFQFLLVYSCFILVFSCTELINNISKKLAQFKMFGRCQILKIFQYFQLFHG